MVLTERPSTQENERAVTALMHLPSADAVYALHLLCLSVDSFFHPGPRRNVHNEVIVTFFSRIFFPLLPAGSMAALADENEALIYFGHLIRIAVRLH